MKKLLAIIVLLLSMIGLSQAADPEPAKSDPTWLTEARASIKSDNYDQAIKQLQAANETVQPTGITYWATVCAKNSRPIYWVLKNTTKPL